MALGALTIVAFHATVDTGRRVLSALDLDIRASNPWPLLPGYLSLNACALQLHVGESGHPRPITGSIAGIIAVGPLLFGLSASKTSAETPWRLAGELSTDSSLDLGQLLVALVSDDLALPETLPKLFIDYASIQVAPATGELELDGACSARWELPSPGNKVLSLELAVHLASTLAQGKRTFDCILAGAIVQTGEKRPTLLELLTALSGQAITLPGGVPDFELGSITIKINPGAGELMVTGNGGFRWAPGGLQQPIDVDATLNFKRQVKVPPPGHTYELELAVSCAGSFQLTELLGAVAGQSIVLPPELDSLDLEVKAPSTCRRRRRRSIAGR